MAKKKFNNKLAKICLDAFTILLGGLVLVFMALPHIVVYLFGATSNDAKANGYELIDFSEGSNTGIAVVLLLIVIFACIMILGALLKVLYDAGVVKNKTFGSIAKVVMFVASAILAVLVIVNLITIGKYCSDNSGIDSVTHKFTGAKATWVVLIANAVFGVGSAVSSALSLKK